MRPTQEELQRLNGMLANSLELAGFSVKVNKYGSIVYAEKNGIRCCPAILPSLEDGRHGYAYINLVTNPYSAADIGSRFKPSSSGRAKANASIDKYSGDGVRIDERNAGGVISRFIDDLSKDYVTATSTPEAIEPIKDLGGGMCRWNSRERMWEIASVGLKAEIKAKLREISPEDADRLSKEPFSCSVWLVGFDFPTETLTIAESESAQRITVQGKAGVSVIVAVEDWVRRNKDKVIRVPLTEESVRITGTGTAFDGKSGVVEKDGGDKLTVLIDFAEGKKVRNIFRKENVEIQDGISEDIRIDSASRSTLSDAVRLKLDALYPKYGPFVEADHIGFNDSINRLKDRMLDMGALLFCSDWTQEADLAGDAAEYGNAGSRPSDTYAEVLACPKDKVEELAEIKLREDLDRYGLLSCIPLKTILLFVDNDAMDDLAKKSIANDFIYAPDDVDELLRDANLRPEDYPGYKDKIDALVEVEFKANGGSGVDYFSADMAYMSSVLAEHEDLVDMDELIDYYVSDEDNQARILSNSYAEAARIDVSSVTGEHAEFMAYFIGG